VIDESGSLINLHRCNLFESVEKIDCNGVLKFYVI